MKKKCTICHQFKHAENFGPSGRPDGSIHSQCNHCRNKKSRERTAKLKKENEDGFISNIPLYDYNPKEEVENFDELDGIF